MTKEDIIRMAKEAGFDPHDMSDDFTCNLEDIECFAALVAKHERNACAKLVEADGLARGSDGLIMIKAAGRIRARGEP